jgi:hypothetical protein
MTDTDEFTDDDIQHVKQLEAFMRASAATGAIGTGSGGCRAPR